MQKDNDFKHFKRIEPLGMVFFVKNSILAKTADEPLWLLTGELSNV
jgi:hypothetical protein